MAQYVEGGPCDGRGRVSHSITMVHRYDKTQYSSTYRTQDKKTFQMYILYILCNYIQLACAVYVDNASRYDITNPPWYTFMSRSGSDFLCDIGIL